MKARFIKALEKKIAYWQTSPYDPHNINTAVLVALREVRDAYKTANKRKRKKA